MAAQQNATAFGVLSLSAQGESARKRNTYVRCRTETAVPTRLLLAGSKNGFLRVRQEKAMASLDWIRERRDRSVHRR